MTSPVQQIKVECPACSTVYDDWFRASVNLDLDPQMDEEYLEQASTATCPSCGHTVDLGTLVVGDESEIWRAER